MNVHVVTTKTQAALHALPTEEALREAGASGEAVTPCGIPWSRCVEPDPDLTYVCLICRPELERGWTRGIPAPPEEKTEEPDATWDALEAARLALGRASKFLEVVGRKVKVSDEARLVRDALHHLNDARLLEAVSIVQRGLPLAERYPDGNARQDFPLTRKQITYLRDLAEREERAAFLEDADVPDPHDAIRQMELREGRREPRTCTGSTKQGEPCRSNAMPFVEEQRCVAHGSPESIARNDATKRRVKALAREIWSDYERRRLIAAERSVADPDGS